MFVSFFVKKNKNLHKIDKQTSIEKLSRIAF